MVSVTPCDSHGKLPGLSNQPLSVRVLRCFCLFKISLNFCFPSSPWLPRDCTLFRKLATISSPSFSPSLLPPSSPAKRPSASAITLKLIMKILHCKGRAKVKIKPLSEIWPFEPHWFQNCHRKRQVALDREEWGCWRLWGPRHGSWSHNPPCQNKSWTTNPGYFTLSASWVNSV